MQEAVGGAGRQHARQAGSFERASSRLKQMRPVKKKKRINDILCKRCGNRVCSLT